MDRDLPPAGDAAVTAEQVRARAVLGTGEPGWQLSPAPDANESMKRRDREGAPWIPLTPNPPRMSDAECRRAVMANHLARAVRRMHEVYNNVTWAPLLPRS